MRARPGHTLVELAVAMPLALLLAATILLGVMAQARLARVAAARAARMEAERVAASVLAAELRWSSRDDLRGSGGDSVRLRALRGVGIPCEAAPDRVRWHGVRGPAPGKDSVLRIEPQGERVVALSGAAVDAPCAGYRLSLENAAAPGIVLLFETGTYYLRDRALRYRTGGEGRQPLTEEWFRHPETELLRDSAGAVRGATLGFRTRPDHPWTETHEVRWTAPNLDVR